MSQSQGQGRPEASPTDIRTEKGEDDLPTAYECDFHVQTGTISVQSGIVKDSYYDMLYPCDLDPLDGIKLYGVAVLENIAEEFGILPSGNACVIPNTKLPLWMIGVSSEPADSIVETLECQKLSTKNDDSMCCVVVKAPMTFWWTDGEFSDEDILDVLKSQWRSPLKNMVDAEYEIEYLGAFMETTEGDVKTYSPPRNDESVFTGAVQEIQQDNNKFTIVGGFVLGGLLAVFVGAVFVLMRRRNRARQSDIEVAIQKSGSYGEHSSDGPTLEVDVMSDDMPRGFYPGGINNDNVGNSYNDAQQEDFPTPSSYTFDLANSLKNDVMGAYFGNGGGSSSNNNNNHSESMGPPTSMAVVLPYSMDETSDSEVDSWAQTDGTVGSLEDRLEEITAEI